MVAKTTFNYASMSVHVQHVTLVGCKAKASVPPSTCPLESMCTLCGPKSVILLGSRVPDLRRLRKQLQELGDLGYKHALVLTDTPGMRRAESRLRKLGGGR